MKKKRKSKDYTQLVMTSGYLTPAFWILKEGLTQGIRKLYYPGSKMADFGRAYLISQLVERGYLEYRQDGLRGGGVWHTTGVGVFAVLAAEAAAQHYKQKAEDEKEIRSRRNKSARERYRKRLANTQVSTADCDRQETQECEVAVS